MNSLNSAHGVGPCKRPDRIVQNWRALGSESATCVPGTTEDVCESGVTMTAWIEVSCCFGISSWPCMHSGAKLLCGAWIFRAGVPEEIWSQQRCSWFISYFVRMRSVPGPPHCPNCWLIELEYLYLRGSKEIDLV